jgi:hypothetical protein
LANRAAPATSHATGESPPGVDRHPGWSTSRSTRWPAASRLVQNISDTVLLARTLRLANLLPKPAGRWSLLCSMAE